jgi:plasmid stability protein
MNAELKLRLPPELKRALEVRAAAFEISTSQYLRAIIRNELAREVPTDGLNLPLAKRRRPTRSSA